MGKTKGKKIEVIQLNKRATPVELDVDLQLDDLEDDELELEAERAIDDEAEEVESVTAEVADDEYDSMDDDAEIEPADDTGEFDSVAHYFRESARHRLLSGEHERTLTEAVKRGRTAQRKLQSGKPIGKIQAKKLQD